jgi:putative membrane protein
MSVPPIVLCAAAAALYALGGRGRVGGTTRSRRWREAAFYAGVLVVAAALEPPLDTLADTSFAMHMVQHVLLLTVAPPLLVLGRPWPRMWMPFPPDARRAAARGIARGSWAAPLRLLARVLTRPPAALALLSLTLAVWHVPTLYDAAVANEGVHVFEHACFLVASLLFWGPLLEAPPVRARTDHLRRAVWFGLAAVPGWILAIVLAYASNPLYPAYAHLAHRAFGLGPLGDQQVGAGVMWVPGSASFLLAFVYFVYRWLEPGAVEGGAVFRPSVGGLADDALSLRTVETSRREPRPEELSWT